MPLSDEEITRLLAEKVMDWPAPQSAEKARELVRAGQGVICRADVYAPGASFARWHPLESIADAWMVMEAMGLRGFSGGIQWKGAGRTYAETAEAYFMLGIATNGHAANASAPRAICYAALRAVGVEPEG